jgi:hypothetical protein
VLVTISEQIQEEVKSLGGNVALERILQKLGVPEEEGGVEEQQEVKVNGHGGKENGA